MSKRVGKNSPMRCGDPCSPRTGRGWGCGWRSERVKGETNAEKLAALAANNVKASREELADALRGPMQPAHRKVLGMWLEQVEMIDRQIVDLHLELGKALRSHQEPIARLC